jgi:hypothetical protein
MNVITDKTASLIATAGRFGAMFSDAPAGVAARIATACGAFGVAWQLADDILDVASESAESGKTPGTDLREGVPTLPVYVGMRWSPGRHGLSAAQRRRAFDPALAGRGAAARAPAMDMAWLISGFAGNHFRYLALPDAPRAPPSRLSAHSLSSAPGDRAMLHCRPCAPGRPGRPVLTGYQPDQRRPAMITEPR